MTRLVREALAGDQQLSLRLFAPAFQRGSSYVEYGSREGDPEARPQLLIRPARGLEVRRPSERRELRSPFGLLGIGPAGWGTSAGRR